MVVEIGCGSVPVFGPLPEEPFVIAHEGGTFGLRLVLQYGIPFVAKLFGRDGDGHFDVVHFPLCPCSSVHPNAAILQPCFFFEVVDGRQYGIEAHFVGAMRVG